MSPHFHIGGLELIVFALHLVIVLFLLRMAAVWLTARNENSKVGRALGAIVLV